MRKGFRFVSILRLTQETTLPLKQGSLAPSSEISSFTTLRDKEIKKEKRKDLSA